MFSNRPGLRISVAIALASVIVFTGLVHASFAQLPLASGNGNGNGKSNDNNTYSNLHFGIERIDFPKGWARTIQEQNNTAGTATDEITITLKLENATTTATPSPSSSSLGTTSPFSLSSIFSSPADGNSDNNSTGGISSSDNGNGKSAADPFNPTITIQLQKGEALHKALAAEQNQTGGQEIDLFAQNPFCKQLDSRDGDIAGGNGSGNNNTVAANTATVMIDNHSFKVTEQECDLAPLLKLFFGAFLTGFANLANNDTSTNTSPANSQNTTNGGTVISDGGNATNNAPSNTNTTSTNADNFAETLGLIHNMTTTEKTYTYTSPSSNLRVKLSYSALTFVSVQDFEVKVKHYQRYLPVFEDMVHSIKIQQIKSEL